MTTPNNGTSSLFPHEQAILTLAQSRLLKDGRSDWGFIPADQKHPNLGKVLRLGEAFAETLHKNGVVETSELVLRDTILFLLGKSRKYSAGGYGWRAYERSFGYSPCCSCDWQSEVSGIAATLGFTDLSRSVVEIQCPVSPPEYRRNPEKGWSLSSARHYENVLILAAFNLGTYDLSRKGFEELTTP
ncbi:MAG: hypothetical protein RLZZ347_812 [Candidatus Parcubacteria bacterium]|jgi:hypothetical protein